MQPSSNLDRAGVRSLIPCALAATCALTVAGQAHAVSALPNAGIEIEVMGRYQAATDAPAVASLPGGGSLTLRAEAGPPPVAPVTAGLMIEGSVGEARSALPGTFGTYANAGGVSPPFAPGLAGLEAYARSTQVSHWVVTSSNPLVTSATISVTAFYHGTLYVGDYAGNNTASRLYSSVSAMIAADTDTDRVFEVLFDARLDEHTGLSATANWASSITKDAGSSLGSTGDKLYNVSYVQTFVGAFTVPVNVPFAWTAELTSEAVAPGPIELFAQSNFFATGSFDMATDTPGTALQLVTTPVPEPTQALLMLIGFGAAVAATTRRRTRPGAR